jgi:hypothetical protein
MNSCPRSWRLSSANWVACALTVGDQRAVRAGAQLALPRLVAVEDVVEDAGAAGLGQELGPEPDQAAGGDPVLEPDPAGAVVDHLLHAALAQAEQLGDDADVVLGHVDRQRSNGSWTTRRSPW